jgi:hypothetical protein
LDDEATQVTNGRKQNNLKYISWTTNYATGTNLKNIGDKVSKDLQSLATSDEAAPL